MELKFDNKISEKQVLSKANKNKSPFELNYNGSMLFMGDNFEVLSILLNNFRGKINLIYIDPPFNTDQEFFVSENGRANSISHSKNDIVAYSDKMSTDEYLEFIKTHEVDTVKEINYDYLIKVINQKESVNPHQVNPFYVKLIEVEQKWLEK